MQPCLKVDEFALDELIERVKSTAGGKQLDFGNLFRAAIAVPCHGLISFSCYAHVSKIKRAYATESPDFHANQPAS